MRTFTWLPVLPGRFALRGTGLTVSAALCSWSIELDNVLQSSHTSIAEAQRVAEKLQSELDKAAIVFADRASAAPDPGRPHNTTCSNDEGANAIITLNFTSRERHCAGTAWERLDWCVTAADGDGNRFVKFFLMEERAKACRFAHLLMAGRWEEAYAIESKAEPPQTGETWHYQNPLEEGFELRIQQAISFALDQCAEGWPALRRKADESDPLTRFRRKMMSAVHKV